MNRKKEIKAVIIGASGYTGAELVRLLYLHPDVEIVSLVADSNAGKPIGDIYPNLAHLKLPDVTKLSAVKWDNVDVAFCCLPHATSQEVISSLPKHLKIIDLSADFRINNPQIYEKWYGTPHRAMELQEGAVYGLTEIYRDKIKNANLVACPGCYPTSILLPLIPLLKAKIISPDGIIADSKSGISGAGRSPKVENLFVEINENIKPYSIGGHRHVAEIEQELGIAANKKDMQITFTPQVVPMNRGILSIIYVDKLKGKTTADVKKILVESYKNEPFVMILNDMDIPNTRRLSGTNYAAINVFEDRIPNRVIIISAIDNLVKGASGQAVQNMNVMFGIPETEGLLQVPIFP